MLTGEISDAVSACGARIDAMLELNTTKIHSSIDDMLSNISHQDYETDTVVSERKKILFDADSSMAQVAQAARVLGYELSDSDTGNVYKALMQVCEKFLLSQTKRTFKALDFYKSLI